MQERFPNCANCPECHGEAREGPPQHKEMVELAKKQQAIGGRNFQVAMSAHFVVLTDFRSLKIASVSGPASNNGSAGSIARILLRSSLTTSVAGRSARMNIVRLAGAPPRKS